MNKNDIFGHFQFLIEEGIKRILEACEFYVEMIEKHPNLREEFRIKYPNITAYAWKRYEEVGRHELDHRLIFGMTRNASYLMKLPYPEQKRLMDDPYVEIVPDKNSTVNDKRRVKVSDLDYDQAKQVFGRGHVRTIDEQRAYLKRTEQPAAPKPTGETMKPYEVIKKNGRPVSIKIRKVCEIKIEDLMKEIYS